MTRAFLTCAAVLLAAGCGGGSKPSDDPEGQDALSGGTTTVFDATGLAYSNQAPNLTDAHAESFSFGHSIFDRNWVTAPATTADMDGLGPRFNQRSCSACHSHDGRSPPFSPAGNQLGMLFRLSIPGSDANGGPLGDPTYGTQLRTNAILGIQADGVPHVSYEEEPGEYGDGTSYSLQVPTYTIEDWGYGAPRPELMLSARVAPFTIGLGLLEAIPEEAILSHVRTDDPDGVVGHPNRVWDAATGALALGRFGWKANVASVRDQAAGALVGDMGITSSLFPDETCTAAMKDCRAASSGGSPEIDDTRLDALALYMETLGVPARRDLSTAATRRGARLFEAFGCSSCHVETFQTGDFPGVPELEHQTIHPYTDLLLHDMGEGLADGRPDYAAGPTEWRTPPLWGIGLLTKVNGHELLLHDGRARGMAEAILWHDGEAEAAKDRFRNASQADRDDLIAFLHSL